MPASEVVLVHGLGSTFEHNWLHPGWVDVLAADGMAPRPVHLPGHGEVTPERSAAEVVLSAASEGGVAAVGFSAGAIAVLHAAAAEPGRFTRLAVLGIGDNVLTGGDTRPLAAMLREEHEPSDIRDRTFWRLVRGTGNDPEQVARFVESAQLTVDTTALARIECPVLVVIGDRDEAMPADGLCAALPNAELVVLPDVDHFATPGALRAMDAVSRFLTAG